MRILLAEDDKKLNESLTAQLAAKGFDVDSCYDGEEALYYAEQNIHDVILLDRMLPHLDGTSVLTSLRQQGSGIPVILITALGTLNDKVTGLNLGADDYLVKPFAFEELLARIQCVTRRSPIGGALDHPGRAVPYLCDGGAGGQGSAHRQARRPRAGQLRPAQGGGLPAHGAGAAHPRHLLPPAGGAGDSAGAGGAAGPVWL